MTDERKQQLVSIYAFLKSRELNPEKYGEVEDPEKWAAIIGEDPEMVKTLTDEMSNLPEEYWNELDQQYSDTSQVQSAKNGAKLENLKKLQTYKKGSKMKSKKCACGCDLVETKEAGGKITSKCACGCKVDKKQAGGELAIKAAAMNKEAQKRALKKKK